ncbi:MAG TPA: phage/plasmid primase, P4 family [Acidobacteriaceae bacterium]|jgi:P4 family phage/plasmid primase-like protien|nr:phage/plasmid primase, P4 family [Acidobacteriaceae bacterium]
MSLFTGTHEVRVKTARGVFAGYFDSEAAALSAVERLDDYTAAWATLNPLRPDVLTPDTTMNPAELVRTHNAAADAHTLRRDWILLDFDPPRPKGTNSTDAEKAAAHQQAEQCRHELAALSWPAPMLIDSGNGYHLRYHINLPNDAAAHELVCSVLRSLAERYSMLDVTNHNAARVAKLPGTWARKGEHTDERPHRTSTLLEAGDAEVVSEAQMRELVPHAGSERNYGAPEEITSEAAKAAREWLLGYLDHFELVPRKEARRTAGGWKVGIYCPLTETDEQPHDEGISETSTILQIINGRLSFKCSHNTCEKAERNTAVFKQAMMQRNPVPYLPEPGADAEVTIGTARRTRPLPPLLQADLGVDFLRDNQDFALLVGTNPPLLAAWTGKAWEVRPDRRLLSKAVNAHLKNLYALYPPPAEGRDRRGMLKASDTLGGVVSYAWLDLSETRREQFDTDEYLLGLPGGLAANLRTGEVRHMQREDYISRCLTVAPDANHPTPRWTRFLREIAGGDADLAEYLRRLCALCLTAHAEHAIFALYGSGRNGKGSYIRVIQGILGSMAVLLRPRELAESKFADDANKRTLSTLDGARLVCVQEAKTDNLDFPLLKVLSGGDTVSAAAMRENARQIKPTWKLFLTTNEQPIFPADAAFRGRVHLVPFRADFSEAPETTIDGTLHGELPGILAELIALCPSVIRDGLGKPAAVKNSTEELFAELDVAAQFRAACLEGSPDGKVSYADMVRAVTVWTSNSELDGDVIQKVIADLKKQKGVKYKTCKIDGRPVKGFVGVRLRPLEADPA